MKKNNLVILSKTTGIRKIPITFIKECKRFFVSLVPRSLGMTAGVFLAYMYMFQSTFAASNVLGLSESKLRNGDIHIEDIPVAIKGAIDFFMGIAGTIAVIFVIVGAYKILFGSLQQDKTKGRDTIIAALVGFALAALSWLIIRFIIDNLS